MIGSWSQVFMVVLASGCLSEICVNPNPATKTGCNKEENIKQLQDIFEVKSNVFARGSFGEVSKILWGDKVAAVKKVNFGDNKSKQEEIERETKTLEALQNSGAVVKCHQKYRDKENMYVIQEMLYDSTFNVDAILEQEKKELTVITDQIKKDKLKMSKEELQVIKTRVNEGIASGKLKFNDMNMITLERLQSFFLAREKLKRIIKMAEKVDLLHKAGYSHQDIKPDNIMAIDEDKTDFKLIDLGFTVLKGEPSPGQSIGFASFSKLIKNIPEKRSDLDPPPKKSEVVLENFPDDWIYDNGDEIFKDDEDYQQMSFYKLFRDSDGKNKKDPEPASFYHDVYAFALMICQIVYEQNIFKNLDQKTIFESSIEDIERRLSKNLEISSYYSKLENLDKIIRKVIFQQDDSKNQITTMESLIKHLNQFQEKWLANSSFHLGMADFNLIGRPKAKDKNQRILI